MILILIESTDSFAIYDKNFIRRLTTMLFNFYWLCPNPKTLKNLVGIMLTLVHGFIVGPTPNPL
jgi:hypothetical protein